MNLHNLINEAEFKLEVLPESYFMEYFEKTFLPAIKNINKQLHDKCNEQADSLPVAEFQNEIKCII